MDFRLAISSGFKTFELCGRLFGRTFRPSVLTEKFSIILSCEFYFKALHAGFEKKVRISKVSLFIEFLLTEDYFCIIEPDCSLVFLA